MTTSFSRTRGFVGIDDAKGWLSLGVVALGISCAWLLWFTTSQVTLVEAARHARLEADAYVHTVEFVAGGKVVDQPVSLGHKVEAGDLLLALETEHQVHALEEARAELAAWKERLAASQAALENLKLVATRDGELTERQLAEIEAKRTVELVTFDYAQQRAERSEKLFGLGLVSEVDLLHHQGDAEKADAEARVRQAEAAALEAKSRRDAVKQAAELAEIESDIGEARGEISVLQARIDLLLHEIEDLHLRAPVAGRVGWLAPLRIGAVAEVGDRLAEIVPEDAVRVVGYFPRTAVGRLAIGQNARLRLDALPWTRYGTIDLTVERLATEVEDDEVRVELAVLDEPQLPLSHGMTGSLEVTVEQTTPAQWLLQAVGRATPPDSVAD